MCTEDRKVPYPNEEIQDAINTLQKLINKKDEFSFYEERLDSVDIGFLNTTVMILEELK